MKCLRVLFATMFSFTAVLPRIFANDSTAPRVHRQPEPPLFSFVVFSDLHVRQGKSDKGNLYTDKISIRHAQQALIGAHAVRPNASALILDGDITGTGEQSDYDALHRVMQNGPHPRNIWYTIGNHEFMSAYRDKQGRVRMRTFPNGESEASCIQRFLRNTGMPSLYSDTWLHGYHFIFLGSEASRITNRKYYDDAVLSDRQLHWLKRTLANANGDKPTFVFLHQPLPYTVAGSEAPFVVHADKLKSILNQYPQVILFTGHSHVTLRTRERNVVKQDFLMVNTASVRSPVWLSGVPTLGNEGIVVDVYPSRVVIWGREWKEGKWLYEYTQNEPSKWMVAPNMARVMKPVHQSISVLNQ